jgi:large subunit ribosomal protein L30e
VAGFEQELRTAYKTGKLSIGSKTTLKYLKHGKAKLVIVAKNSEPMLKKDIEYYASLSKTPVYWYEGTSFDLGMLLGKPFPIQAIAVLDPGDSHITEIVEE